MGNVEIEECKFRNAQLFKEKKELEKELESVKREIVNLQTQIDLYKDVIAAKDCLLIQRDK